MGWQREHCCRGWGEPHREQKGTLPEGPASRGGKSLLFGNQQAQLAMSTPIPGHRQIHSFPFLASSQLSFYPSVLSNNLASPQPQQKLPTLQDPLNQRATQGAGTGLQAEFHCSSYPRHCLAVVVFAELPSITFLGMGRGGVLTFHDPVLPSHPHSSSAPE